MKDIRIVVLDRGWVVVGQFWRSGDQCKVTHGYVVRRWGTSEGLGELAIKGKLENTKLDKATDINFDIKSMILSFDCHFEKWGNLCS